MKLGKQQIKNGIVPLDKQEEISFSNNPENNIKDKLTIKELSSASHAAVLIKQKAKKLQKRISFEPDKINP